MLMGRIAMMIVIGAGGMIRMSAVGIRAARMGMAKKRPAQKEQQEQKSQQTPHKKTTLLYRYFTMKRKKEEWKKTYQKIQKAPEGFY